MFVLRKGVCDFDATRGSPRNFIVRMGNVRKEKTKRKTKDLLTEGPRREREDRGERTLKKKNSLPDDEDSNEPSARVDRRDYNIMVRIRIRRPNMRGTCVQRAYV